MEKRAEVFVNGLNRFLTRAAETERVHLAGPGCACEARVTALEALVSETSAKLEEIVGVLGRCEGACAIEPPLAAKHEEFTRGDRPAKPDACSERENACAKREGACAEREDALGKRERELVVIIRGHKDACAERKDDFDRWTREHVKYINELGERGFALDAREATLDAREATLDARDATLNQSAAELAQRETMLANDRNEINVRVAAANQSATEFQALEARRKVEYAHALETRAVALYETYSPQRYAIIAESTEQAQQKTALDVREAALDAGDAIQARRDTVQAQCGDALDAREAALDARDAMLDARDAVVEDKPEECGDMLIPLGALRAALNKREDALEVHEAAAEDKLEEFDSDAPVLVSRAASPEPEPSIEISEADLDTLLRFMGLFNHSNRALRVVSTLKTLGAHRLTAPEARKLHEAINAYCMGTFPVYLGLVPVTIKELMARLEAAQ